LSSTGTPRWAHPIEGNSSYSTMVRSVVATPNGRLFATGKVDLPAQIGRFSLLEPIGQEFPRFGGDFFLVSYGAAIDTLDCHCASEPPVEAGFSWTILPDSQTVQFHNQSKGGSQARWSFGDGQEVVAWSPTHFFTDFDQLEVCVEVSDMCSQSTICQSISLTKPLAFACDPSAWRIGPNPTNGVLNIEFGGAICDSYQVILSDIRGRRLETHQLEVGRTEALSLDLQTRAIGIYLLQIHGKEATRTVRLQRLH
ncbi:MAG: T9SS type A sorting domain-containing protein, partial [Bacteroidota bacterium]